MDGRVDGWMDEDHAYIHTHTLMYREISVTHTASAPKPDLLCGKSRFISHQFCNRDAALSRSTCVEQDKKKKREVVFQVVSLQLLLAVLFVMGT